MAKPNFMNSVQVSKNAVNQFDLSHDHKTSFNMGELIPIMCEEALPGDKWRISAESLVRFQPMVAPVMHRFDATIHYFFVPNRILWPNWENFITNTKLDATDAIPAFPFVTIDTALYGGRKIFDYFGIPIPPAAATTNVNALPFLAYQKIWAEYYRDQNLVFPSAETIKALTTAVDGNNTAEDWYSFLDVRKRAWEHDYFTSCLPFAQKGDAVTIPLSGGNVILDPDQTLNNGVIRKTDGTSLAAGDHDIFADQGGIPAAGATFVAGTVGGTREGIKYDPNGTLTVEGAEATINDLREATKLQEWLEKLARAGSRMTEMLSSMFNVRSQDSRLQRPEYITGVKTPITVSSIANTTGTVDAPQGTLAGQAVSVITGQGGSFYCPEHGFIIGIMSVMPKTAYQQGIQRMWSKITTPLQYYFPQFATLGEQEVTNKEIYAWQGAADDDTFGYLPRYAEHRTAHNRVSGEFRTTLAHWHAGRIFDAPPSLNADFIESDPTHRIFAVTDPEEQKMLVHVYNKCLVTRQIPKFGTPQF